MIESHHRHREVNSWPASIRLEEHEVRPKTDVSCRCNPRHAETTLALARAGSLYLPPHPLCLSPAHRAPRPAKPESVEVSRCGVWALRKMRSRNEFQSSNIANKVQGHLAHKNPPPPKDPAVALYPGTYGDPRVGGCFLRARYPFILHNPAFCISSRVPEVHAFHLSFSW